MIENSISVFDTHWPFHINCHPLLDFIQDSKPNYLILGGDMWDLSFLSHHYFKEFKNKGLDSVVTQLKQEALGFTYFLEQFRAVAKKARIIYITGNHEDWLDDFNREFKQVHEISLHSELPLAKLGIDLIPVGHCFNIGHLYFAHGENYGGQNPAKTAIERSHCSMMIGHHHTELTWASNSDVDDKGKYIGRCVPCMCRKDLKYANHRPNRWLNGFGWSCHKKSGNFSSGVYTMSESGHFMIPSGTEYE